MSRPTLQQFAVTFEVVTQESAEHGEAAERGFILEAGTLRQALALVSGACEADSYPVKAPRWFIFQAEHDYSTGEYESRSLHIPNGVSNSSRMRIAKLLGCYGVRS